MPIIRKAVKKYPGLTLSAIDHFIQSKYHEIRLFSVLLLVAGFQKANSKQQKNIYTFYLAHTDFINNWNLVDVSASHIVGAYLNDKTRKPLYKLIKPKDLW